MKHIAAVLLLALGGKPINEKNIKEVLQSVGVKGNDNCIKLLVEACKAKKPEEIIKEGASKLTTIVMTAGPAAAAPAEDKKDNKKGGKPEKKKEPEPEEDDDMDLGGLF